MRRSLVIAAAGITVGLVALLFTMREAPSAPLACEHVVPMVAITPAPDGGESSRNEAGARAKAVQLVRIAQLLVAVPSGEAGEVQRALSTTADGDRLAELVASQVDTLAARHAGGVGSAPGGAVGGAIYSGRGPVAGRGLVRAGRHLRGRGCGGGLADRHVRAWVGTGRLESG